MNWPKTTEIGKFLAKERFYAQNTLTGPLKQALIDDVEKITISNRLARDTLNVDAGTEFPEILVLKIKLKHKKINEKLLDALDKTICAGYVLFILEYGDKQCASIAHKTTNKTTHKTINSKDSSTIDKRWMTDWTDVLNLELHGTTLDKIYNGFIEQISGGRVKTNGIGLQNAVDRDIERTKLEKQIYNLEKKLRVTVQLNKKFDIKDQIHKIEKKLKDLS